MSDTVIVVETDHGMGGPFDAKAREIATFDDWREAMRQLAERGYSVDFDGRPVPTDRPPRGVAFYHVDPERRHNMGIRSYSLKNLPAPPPHNALPPRP